MAKKVESQLVISARDLGTKKLRELAAAFRQIRQEQKDTANVTDRTAVTMAELRTTISQLEVVMKQIDQRRALVDSFEAAQVAVQKANQRLTEAKAALAAYQAELKQTGASGREASAKITALGRGVTSAENALERATRNADKLGAEIKALGLDSAESQQQLRRLGAVTERALREATLAADALPRQQRAYREELKQTEAAQREVAARQKEVAAEVERRSKETARLTAIETAELKKQAEELDRIAQKRRDVQVAFARDRLQRERQVTSGFGAFSTNADKVAALRREQDEIQRSIALQQRADAVEARLAARKAQTTGILSRLGAAYRAATGAVQQNATAQERAANAAKRAADAQRTALSLTQRVRGQVLSLISAYVGVFGVINLARRSIEASNARIALNTRLLVANGDDARLAAADYKFLRAEADRLGFSLNDLGGVYSKVAIAGRSAGLEAKEVQTIFSSFAEVARVNNLSTEETGRVFRALEQILSKGKVQAEELRGQLGDVLPGAATIFARALGVTTAELDKLLEKGAISSRSLVQFANTYRQQVAGQLPNATKTLNAELGRLQTAWQDFLILISEGGLAEAVRDVAEELQKFFKSAEGKQAAKDIAQLFRLIGDGVLYLLRNVKTILPVIKGFFVILGASVVLKFASDIAVTAAAFVTLTKNLGPATKALTTFFTVLNGGTAAGGASSLLRFLKNPIFLVAAASIGALAYEYKKYQDAVDAAKQPTDAMRKALEDLENARGPDEINAARRRVEHLAREARARLDTAKAVIAQAEANLALVKSTTGPRGEPGEQAARASQQAIMERRLAEARAVLAQAENDIKEYNRKILGFGRGIRGGGAPMAESFDRSSGGTDPALDPNADKDALEKRKRLEEQANELALELYRARLQQQLQLDEDNLEARLELVRAEYEEQLRQARQLRDELAANKLDTSSVDASIAEIERQREIALNEERRLAIVRQRKTLEEESAKVIEERQNEINRLIDERERKLDEIERRRELGQLTDLEARRAAGETELYYQDLVLSKVQALRDLLTSIASGDAKLSKALGIDELLAKLDEIPSKVEAINPVIAQANQLRDQFAQGAAESFAVLAQGIAGVIRGVNSFGDAIRGAWDSFRNFAADFLIQIGQMIIKQAILNRLQEAAKSSGGSGGFFGLLANAVLGTMHTGGIAGRQAKTRSLSPLSILMADRYHTGGVVGLGPDEVPIIAKRGEEMLTEEDPRHRANGGMSKQPIQVINMVDSGSVLSAGFDTPQGKNAFFNFIRANKAAFNAIVK